MCNAIQLVVRVDVAIPLYRSPLLVNTDDDITSPLKRFHSVERNTHDPDLTNSNLFNEAIDPPIQATNKRKRTTAQPFQPRAQMAGQETKKIQ